MTEPHPDPARRWRNRRRMAWLSIAGAMVYPGLAVVTESPALGQIAGPFYALVGGVVLGYLGFATWDDIEITRRGA